MKRKNLVHNDCTTLRYFREKKKKLLEKKILGKEENAGKHHAKHKFGDIKKKSVSNDSIILLQFGREENNS